MRPNVLLLMLVGTVAVVASLAMLLLPRYLLHRPPGDASLQAWRHYSGIHGQVDYVTAYAILEQAIKKGDPVAEMTFATLSRYFDPTYVLPPGFADGAGMRVLELAGQGDHAARYARAMFMETFQPEMEVSSFRDMLAAARAGYEPAFFQVGYCYAYGLDTDVDAEQAGRWLCRAAALGDSSALYTLGYLFSLEDWPEHDYVRAIEHMKEAAQRGYSEAYAAVGYFYRKGLGVEVDPVQALDWYRRGAEIGEPFALHSMGFCYQHGLGVEADEEIARDYLQRAADAGSEKASLVLEALDAGQTVEDPEPAE